MRNDSEIDFGLLFLLGTLKYGIHLFMVHIEYGVVENVLYKFQLNEPHFFLSNDSPVHTVASIYQLGDISLVAIANR